MESEAEIESGNVVLRDVVELKEDITRSPLWNEDLSPVPVAKRNWTTYNYAALWISMAHCIPTYMLASGLIGSGMNWWQAIVTILLGNVIVLAPILLNSHAGTKYGIPFPVFARASYGTVGSNLPALMRAIVACGWFGIQAWIGGHAVHVLIQSVFHHWDGLLGGPLTSPGIIAGYSPTEYISFLIFWAINIYVVFRGMDLLRKVENWAAPFVLVMAVVLMVWAIWRANGLGAIMEEKGKYNTLSEFLPIFIPSLTAMIGYWATLSLNMPDFTRFGRSQREQIVGQVVALPTTMTVFAAMGVIITSATTIIFGKAIWDPVSLIGEFHQTVIVAIAMFTVVVATLSVNIAANVVSPANDFANAFPRLINFRRGGLLTGLIGILMQPWRLLADPRGYIFKWLLGYSGGLGSIAGVLIADYWLVRRTHLELSDLYLPKGAYSYRFGWNWRAVVATLLGCGLAWGGLVIQYFFPQEQYSGVQWLLVSMYDYAWFVGLFVSGLTYLALSRTFPTAVREVQVEPA
ncbi:MAG TPA: NCS1 family nucleobase:cation symporter-1 [Blastocatellia bacterium]|nr:NCS1 family nucleobase:cation symporter-1 [Blastocatellia bacterium]